MTENSAVALSPRDALREMAHEHEEAARSSQEAPSQELPNEDRIGYLLPLNCGHNGSLSLAELNLFQKHLINAQIVALVE